MSYDDDNEPQFDQESQHERELTKAQRQFQFAQKQLEQEKRRALARQSYDPQKQRLEFELRSMSPEERKKKLEEMELKAKRDAENVARFEQIQKEKARQKRQSDKAELQQKQTRGIMNIKSFFETGKIEVRGRIDNVVREVTPVRKTPVAVVSTADTTTHSSAPVQRVYIAEPVGLLQADDEWLTEEQVGRDPMMQRAFKELTTKTVCGCANQVHCNSTLCEHEQDIPVSILERLINPSRPAKGDRVVRSVVHMNPFIDINFPLRDKLPRLGNTTNDTTLCTTIRNDDSSLYAAMTALEPSIDDVVVNMRRSYHQELASLAESYERDRISYAKETAQYRNYVASVGDRSALHFIEERAQQNFEHLHEMFKGTIARLDLTYEHHLTKKLSESKQCIVIARGITIAAFMDILKLKDGRRRDDVYYRQLVRDVCSGIFTNLEKEVNREKIEIGFANRPRTPEPEAVKSERQLEDERFMRNVQSQRVKTIREREKEKAELVRVHDEDIDPDTLKRARKSTPPAPSIPMKEKEQPVVIELDPPRKTWTEISLYSSLVCKAQERPACTPIAFMAALRFAMLRDASDESVQAMGFERSVDTGTKLWEHWKKSHEKVEYMLVEDVKNSSIDSMMEKNSLTSFECNGPWGSVSKSADSTIFKQLEEWLPVVESKASGSQFGAVLTIRSKSVAIARCAGRYYVFDSHGQKSATLACFPSMPILIEALHLRFDGSVEEEQELFQSLPKTTLALASAFSFTMYAIFKP